jgi:hypothetical protein
MGNENMNNETREWLTVGTGIGGGATGMGFLAWIIKRWILDTRNIMTRTECVAVRSTCPVIKDMARHENRLERGDVDIKQLANNVSEMNGKLEGMQKVLDNILRIFQDRVRRDEPVGK